jgi:chromosome segregation ATPase
VEVKDEAQNAYDEASKARNATEGTKMDLEALLETIRTFLKGNTTANPEDIEKVANEVLAMSIPMTQDQIKDLASKINTAIDSLTDIDTILRETEKDRNTADDLKKQAENASSDAQSIRTTAQTVRQDLDEAKRVQGLAEEAIKMANEKIMEAEDDFNTINQETGDVRNITKGSLEILNVLKIKLANLVKRYTALKEDTLERANKAADDATKASKEAYDKVEQLVLDYNDTAEMVNDKYIETTGAQERAEKLKKRADEIYSATETKLNELKDIEKKISGNEETLNNLDKQIKELNRRMDIYLDEIRKKAKFYETC